MKFTAGFWQIRKEYTPAYAVEYHSHRVTKCGDQTVLEVFAPSRPVTGHADSLNLPMLTYRFTAPLPGAVRVQITHFDGAAVKGPFFNTESHPCDPVITDTPEALLFYSGPMQVIISKKPCAWSVSFIWDQNGTQTLLTESSYRNAAAMFHQDGRTFIIEQLRLSVSESLYGLGERFTPFVKNGQAVDMWQEDGGTASEIAYKNIPFYLSSRGYGVLADTPADVSYEIGSEKVERAQFSVEGQSLAYVVFGGASMKDALSRYTAYTGYPALPPAWSFGLWLSTSFTTAYDEKTVMSFINGMRERDLPLSVFHFDCCWMKDFEWTSFEWNEAVFPDPQGLLNRLHALGLKVCVWINPYIAQKSPLFQEGMAGGYLVCKTDGSVWQTDMWQAGMALVDFTNPDAAAWYQNRLGRVLDQGVDCVKTDFGERIPVKDIVWHDGSDPVKMHNYYTHLYNEAVFSLLQTRRGRGDAIVFARSATAGGQKYPVHWGGDSTASALSMAETLRAGLSLACCGFGFWSHDIGGFEQSGSPEVYKRWLPFGMLSSHSRLHGSTGYRVPWVYDEESVDVLRFFTKLKLSLMPYLFAKAVEAHQTGIPMMRPMVMEFTQDRSCHPLDTQYMLGESLLAAPVFRDDSVAEFYLPQGEWTCLLTGRVYSGGRWFTRKEGFLSMPLFVRENTLLIRGGCDTRPDYDYADGFTAELYHIKDGAELSAPLYDLNGIEKARVTAVRRGNTVTVRASGAAGAFRVAVPSQKHVVEARGGAVELAWMP
ncbi:MAG: alpha-xylosidase [Clostridia bacterium]|nr:alpha-xylosidase [Clostridia bacterium]